MVLRAREVIEKKRRIKYHQPKMGLKKEDVIHLKLNPAI